MAATNQRTDLCLKADVSIQTDTRIHFGGLRNECWGLGWAQKNDTHDVKKTRPDMMIIAFLQPTDAIRNLINTG